MDFVDRFQHLHVNRSHGTESPHKPAMLLAVMDMIEAEAAPANRIEFSPDLRERFKRYFDLVATERDHPHAHYPFFHLKTEPFWKLVPAAGREAVVEAMSTVRKASEVGEAIACARLDDALFAEMRDPGRRAALREALIVRYFPMHAVVVRELIRRESRAGDWQRQLAALPEGPSAVHEGAPPDPVEDEARRAAFRRLVLPAWDYLCAGCGVRLSAEDSWLVEACHLIPWRETHDDDPRNGIALCPNHHWAMDNDLIAPGPDLVWHASRELDRRIESERALLDLAGAKILGPAAGWERYAPKDEALEWRLERLG